jgi:hypothetical protein
VEVVGMIFVNDRHMAAIGTMHVVMSGVLFTFAHNPFPFVLMPFEKADQVEGI